MEELQIAKVSAEHQSEYAAQLARKREREAEGDRKIFEAWLTALETQLSLPRADQGAVRKWKAKSVEAERSFQELRKNAAVDTSPDTLKGPRRKLHRVRWHEVSGEFRLIEPAGCHPFGKVMNRAHTQHNAVYVKLDRLGKDKLSALGRLNGNYVRLFGSYERGYGHEPQFVLERFELIAEEYFIDGQLVRSRQISGSAPHLLYYVVDEESHWVSVNIDLRMALKFSNHKTKVRLYGSFGTTGHKGYIAEFVVSRIETLD